MSNKNRLISGAAGALLVVIALTASVSVQAGSSAGAFIGGMLTTKVLSNMHQRTQAEQQQAYYAQQNAQWQPVQQAAPASSTQSTEQKLKELETGGGGLYHSGGIQDQEAGHY